MKGMQRVGMLAVSLALVGSMGLSACGSNQTSDQGSSATASASAAGNRIGGLQAIGTEQEGGLDIVLTNGLTKPLTSLSLSESGAGAYGDELMSSGQFISANEQVHLLLAPTYATDAHFDLKAVMSGGSFFEYKDLALTNIEKISLGEVDGYAYYECTLKDGSTVSTMAEAEAQRDAAQATAMAAASETASQETAQETTQEAAQAATQEATQDTTANNGYNSYESYDYYEAPAEQTYEAPAEQTYEAPVEQTYEAPVEQTYEETAPVETVVVEDTSSEEAPAQSTDSCLGDDILLR